MNCERVRRVLLAAETPERAPAALRPHLNGCSSCRDWLRRLTTAEMQLALLPLPASQARDRLLREVREMGPSRAPLPSQEIPLPARLKERGLRKLSMAFALAAAVAVFAVGLWLWPHRDHDAGPSLVKGPESGWEQQRVKRLAKVRTPGEHVKALCAFAVKLQDEATDLACRADAPRLEALAQYYDNLVCQDLVSMAANVPADERAVLFGDVRAVLGRAESEMERLAVNVQGSAASLRRIARAARECDQRLRELLESAGA